MENTIRHNSDEKLFLERREFEKNEHGVYIYVSKNGKHYIDLPSILEDYREFLNSKEYLAVISKM